MGGRKGGGQWGTDTPCPSYPIGARLPVFAWRPFFLVILYELFFWGHTVVIFPSYSVKHFPFALLFWRSMRHTERETSTKFKLLLFCMAKRNKRAPSKCENTIDHSFATFLYLLFILALSGV